MLLPHLGLVRRKLLGTDLAVAILVDRLESWRIAGVPELASLFRTLRHVPGAHRVQFLGDDTAITVRIDIGKSRHVMAHAPSLADILLVIFLGTGGHAHQAGC